MARVGVTGREISGFAFAKCGTNSWNVAASVLYGMRFRTASGYVHSPNFIDDRSFGESFLPPSEQGDVNAPNVTFTGQQRYEDNNYKWEALAMGSPAAVAISTSTNGQVTSWLHVFDLAPSCDGLAITGAMNKQLFVEEMTSGKITGMSETRGENGVMDQSFTVLGSQITDISSVNTNSTVGGASFPAVTTPKIKMLQGVFRINAQAGGALGSSDEIPLVEALEFSFSRAQDAPHVYGSAYIIEPSDNEFPEMSFNVTFARMNTVTGNSLRAAMRTGAVYKCDWTYSGAFINSTDRYQKKYQFPYAELRAWAAEPAGAAQLKPTATFVARKPGSAPTGMSGVTNPFRLSRIMVNSVNAFS